MKWSHRICSLFFALSLLGSTCFGSVQLRVVVRDTEGRALKGIELQIGSQFAVTTNAGEGVFNLRLTEIGDTVRVAIVRPANQVLLSPIDGNIVVPRSGALVVLTLTKRGSKVLHQTTPLINKTNELDDLTAKNTKDIRDVDSRAQAGASSEKRRLAILATAQAFGLSEEDVAQRLDSKAIPAAAPSSPSKDQSFKPFTLEFTDGIPDSLVRDGAFLINQNEVAVRSVERGSNAITVLGDNTATALVHDGINILAQKTDGVRQQFQYWSDARKLTEFANPYKNSYAVISAIDDYDRERDPLHRGKTGFRSLKGTMVKGANDLKIALENLGFPANHIATFYNEQATSTALNETLYRFWQGHELENADRVFFYFGGHGSQVGKSGLLVTYDYDLKRPTTTALLASDLTIRHSQNIQARHVLFALDSCHAGLAIDLLDTPVSEREVRSPRQLSVIRANAEKVARNLLLAGTGDQSALWVNGGIFTKVLVAGLAGNADLNHDGIIEFDELKLYVRNEVIEATIGSGIRQEPDGYVLTKFGQGRVLFISNH